MDADSYFWAGMSGGRANQIRRLHEDIDAWAAHVKELNQTIDELRASYERVNRVAKDWGREAVRANANAAVALQAFKEAQGQTVREYLGDAETERRLAFERDDYRKDHNLEGII